jgi:hypothetical protein
MGQLVDATYRDCKLTHALPRYGTDLQPAALTGRRRRLFRGH